LTPIAIREGKVHCWRLDATDFAQQWDSGFGAEKYGGRWNAKGTSLVYGTLDPATTILEKAVHTGVEAMQAMRQTLTEFQIPADAIEILEPKYFPNQNWLHPVERSRQQQTFLSSKLNNQAKPFVILPSVVSPKSWCLVFKPNVAKGRYHLVTQEQFSLDPRLSSS
jgi:RES domain-containing protein